MWKKEPNITSKTKQRNHHFLHLKATKTQPELMVRHERDIRSERHLGIQWGYNDQLNLHKYIRRRKYITHETRRKKRRSLVI